jgi:hypothetical protein
MDHAEGTDHAGVFAILWRGALLRWRPASCPWRLDWLDQRPRRRAPAAHGGPVSPIKLRIVVVSSRAETHLHGGVIGEERSTISERFSMNGPMTIGFAEMPQARGCCDHRRVRGLPPTKTTVAIRYTSASRAKSVSSTTASRAGSASIANSVRRKRVDSPSAFCEETDSTSANRSRDGAPASTQKRVWLPPFT